MNTIFVPCLRKFILVFFDDILLYSLDYDTHLEHLSIVLQLLKDHDLYAKMSKYTFTTQKVQYVGHVITTQGVAIDPNKIVRLIGLNQQLLRD